MKNIIILLSIAILFVSCQEEYDVITEPDKKSAFIAGDTIAVLMLKVTLKDGSFDNFIDNCSAISINFPYSVRIRNEEINIDSLDDIERIEQEYDQFRNAIIINYPVTVTFSDYSDTLLSNRGELKKIQNQFNKNKEDDDIECIDFVYPVEINLYNTEFQKADFKRVQKDKDMHGLLSNLDNQIVEINYPVQVEIWDGTTISIYNNPELQNEIINAMGRCDEDDQVFNNENDAHDG